MAYFAKLVELIRWANAPCEYLGMRSHQNLLNFRSSTRYQRSVCNWLIHDGETTISQIGSMIVAAERFGCRRGSFLLPSLLSETPSRLQRESGVGKHHEHSKAKDHALLHATTRAWKTRDTASRFDVTWEYPLQHTPLQLSRSVQCPQQMQLHKCNKPRNHNNDTVITTTHRPSVLAP